MSKPYNNKFYQNQIFQGLNHQEIDTLSQYFKPVTFAAGKRIIEENSTGDTLYLLLDGKVIVDKTLVSLFEDVEIGPEDKKIIEVNADQNLYFGEMSLFNQNQKRSASIIAKTAVQTASLTKQDFEKIIASNSVIGCVLLKNIILKLSNLLDNANVEISKLITAFTIALRN
jgi:CRP-like cAMP-binding protein